MALAPFLDQDTVDKTIQDFHTQCVRKVTIGNSSVLDGLNAIQALFTQYGQSVKPLFNGQPTAFVETLIDIYKMKQHGTISMS